MIGLNSMVTISVNGYDSFIQAIYDNLGSSAVSISTTTTNKNLSVNVTGYINNTYNWTAYVEWVEIPMIQNI